MKMVSLAISNSQKCSGSYLHRHKLSAFETAFRFSGFRFRSTPNILYFVMTIKSELASSFIIELFSDSFEIFLSKCYAGATKNCLYRRHNCNLLKSPPI